MSVAPACSNGAKYSPGWFSEPLNIRCSNRCAKPLRPAGSFLLHTPYQMLTATIGALWSSCTITVRRLGRVNSWYGMVTWAAALPVSTHTSTALELNTVVGGKGG